jgi:uncharacterized membrane-anchored protein
VKFQPGNQLAQGGRRAGSGRPTTEAAAAKNEMLNAALDALKMGSLKAVLTLTERLESADEAITVRAAVAILDFALKSYQVQELEARIAALEKKLDERGGGI